MTATKKRETPGEYFKNARLNAGLTQSDVSKHLGYSTPQFVSNWERDLCLPPKNALQDIIKLYKLEKEEVLDKLLLEEERHLEKAIYGRVFD